MSVKSSKPHLQSIMDALEHIHRKMEGVSMDDFQGDLDRRRIVERSVEIISEASRRLPEDLKARHSNIPWKKVAGVGNILRHDYENVIPDALWKLCHDNLPLLEQVCREELKRETERINRN